MTDEDGLTDSLRSARIAVNAWPTVKPYGYYPWNFLAKSTDSAGNAMVFDTTQIEDTGLVILHIPGSGEFTVTIG